MTKEDKETLRLTLMAFENNSANVRNIRLKNLNNLALDEVKALLSIEQKMDIVKYAIMDIMVTESSRYNNLGFGSEFEAKAFRQTNNSFLHDNVD
jgi:N12 class adenine-specific DNA methylase